MTEQQDIVDRLTFLEEMMNIPGALLAKSIGVDQSQYSKIKRRKIGVTLKQILDISALFDIRVGWLAVGEEPMFKEITSGTNLIPDAKLRELRKQISTAIISLQEAMKTLPQPLGPEISASYDPAFHKADKTKNTEKQ